MNNIRDLKHLDSALLENANGVMAIFDVKGNIVRINHLAENIKGFVVQLHRPYY